MDRNILGLLSPADREDLHTTKKGWKRTSSKIRRIVPEACCRAEFDMALGQSEESNGLPRNVLPRGALGPGSWG